jgi:hypothetical protein
MTNPIYRRTALKLAVDLYAETVVLLVVGRSGVIHTGSCGPGGEEIAAGALDVALDVLHPRAPVPGVVGEGDGT